jgi:hypothetical protein
MTVNEKVLRKLVADEFHVLDGPEPSDDDCRTSCSTILKAIHSFLAVGQSVDNDIPLLFLRETVSRILQEIGPGDTLFRTRWCAILKNATSSVALKFALEFVPCALPPQNKAASNQVVSALDQLAEAHHEVLADVFHCLEQLVSVGKLGKKAAFHFFVNHLSQVPNTSMERAIHCLLDHCSDEHDQHGDDVDDDKENIHDKHDDWSLAIETVRKTILGDGDVDQNENKMGRYSIRLASIASALISFHQDRIHEQFFDAYLNWLDDTCSTCRMEDAEDAGKRLLTELDLVILLLHRAHKDHGTYVQQILNNAVCNGTLDSKKPASLARLLWMDDTLVDASRLQGLHMHLIWLLIFLCVRPLHCLKRYNVESVASLAVEFGSELLRVSPRDQQQSVVSALLLLNDECLLRFAMSGSLTLDNGMLEVQSVQAVVVEILMACVGSVASIVKREVPRLANALSGSGVTIKTAVALCRIMISADASGEGDDGVSALTRMLLFSTGDESAITGSDRGGQDERKIRGLIMIAEMVKSERYSESRLARLWQSLQRTLLPPSDRLMDPRIGIYGLKAIRAFHSWLQSSDHESRILLQPEIFPTMTSILMKSRLVQYANASKKTIPRDPGTLGYSVRPNFFKGQGAKQRPYHKMIFSFDTLLNDQVVFTPRHWELSARWVHDLIDTYLTLGRTKSKGKWIPHAWVEAAFYFPDTEISSLRATTSRQQRVVEKVGGALQEFNACNVTVISKTSLEKDFGEALKQLKKSVDRAKFLRGLLRSSASYCLALALSAGILANTFAHYSEILEGEEEKDARERNEATRMMQYQLAKMYDLVEKCRIVECIFRGISSISLRGKRRHKKGNRGKSPSSIFGDMVSRWSVPF